MKEFSVYSRLPITPIRGKGAYIYDEHDTEYLDFYGGHAVISVGHSHPHYVHRIQEQISQLGFYSNAVKNPLQEEYATKLGELSGCPDYQLFLCNSGAEANENALKLASFYSKRTKVITFKKGFHGRTSAAVNITDNQKIIAPINRGFANIMLELNELTGLERVLETGEVCAVMVEGIQGIGGIHIPKAEWLKQLAGLCKKYGTFLILDEVQSGFGRSGLFFAFQRADIQPDIISMAKGMANGFPVGGILVAPQHQPWKGMLGSTFGGNHLGCAAALATLEIIETENLLTNATQVGQYLLKQLKQVDENLVVRGEGLMIGIDCNRSISKLREVLLFEEKIFVGNSSNPNVIRLLPPLNIDNAHVDLFIKKFKKAYLKWNSKILTD